MTYPVHWLDENFNTRARARELLRPDLEAGLITEHDYNLATTFLPGWHRHYPYAYGAAASLGVVSYGRAYRTPRWSHQRAGALGFVAYFLGTLVGQVQRARAHFRFTQSLENPHGFAQALQNANVRLGGDKPLPWSLPQVGGVVPPTIGQTDVHGDTAHPEEGESIWASDPASSALPVPPERSPSGFPTTTTTTPPKSSAKSAGRWDEIRAVNATAKPSSWDAIRQKYERATTASEQSEMDSTSVAPEASQPYSDRTEEQARFDAILEAERSIARR